jgi:hypothetical protein
MDGSWVKNMMSAGGPDRAVRAREPRSPRVLDIALNCKYECIQLRKSRKIKLLELLSSGH